MKRALAIGMIIVLVIVSTISVCFGDDTDTVSADVTVTAILGAAFDISEKLTIYGVTHDQDVEVSDLRVTNLTADKIIKVENVQAVNSENSSWVLSSLSDVNAAETDSKYLYLCMEDTDLRTGCAPSSGVIKGQNKFKDFTIDGNVPEQSHAVDETEVAKLVVTVSIYDNDGTYDGYSLDILKTVTWSSGTDAEIKAVIKAVDDGALDPYKDLTGWYVGAVRKFYISSTISTSRYYDFTDENGRHYTGDAPNSSVGNFVSGQTYSLVIMDAGGEACKTKTWVDEYGEERGASFIVGFQKCYSVFSCNMSDNDTNWRDQPIRLWLDSSFYEAVMELMNVTAEDNFIKLVRNVTGLYLGSDTTNGGSNLVTYDYISLPAEKEVFGAETNATANEYNDSRIKQFTWYKTADNLVDEYLSSISRGCWWLRSPYAEDTLHWSAVRYDGVSSIYGTGSSSGYFKPFFCI